MNILYLSDTGNVIGGGQISLLGLLKDLDKTKFKPLVLVPFEGDFTERLKELNIPVILFPYKKIKNPLNLLFSVRMFQKLRDIVRQYNINLIHSNTAGGLSILGGLLSRKMGIPYFWHVRVVDSGWLLDVIQGLSANKIMVVSEASKSRFWWLSAKNKLEVIYNGVNLETFHFTASLIDFKKHFGCKPNEFLVGTIGRYHPIKGYEYFIKAAKLVLNKMSLVKFLIVGLDYHENNRYLVKLRNLAIKLNIEDKIIFAGQRDDISGIFSAFDLFVLPSLYEPFGRVIIEAMASQKAVVAFKTGGLPEIVEDGLTGCLVKPKDVKGMAEKITELLMDSDRREELGRKGRMRVEKLFDIKDHVKKIEGLYEELLPDHCMKSTV